jgi:hypothetical protein
MDNSFWETLGYLSNVNLGLVGDESHGQDRLEPFGSGASFSIINIDWVNVGISKITEIYVVPSTLSINSVYVYTSHFRQLTPNRSATFRLIISSHYDAVFGD